MDSSSPNLVRVRMAPSPTGMLHVGTARAGLFNWLFARHHKGTFILRIEDTDKERSLPEHELTIIEGLKWLGLEWDEGPDIGPDGTLITKGDYGPYRQSESFGLYREYLEKLVAEQKAYHCYCTKEELEAEQKALETAKLPPKYSGKCRDLTEPPAGRTSSVIRLKIPEIKVAFDDLIRGHVEFDAALLGDIIIARSLDSALYHFAVVIDDYHMKISHVIRGDDHIANTPKHILIQQALGFPQPIYAHVPLILNADRSKMSKRKNKVSLLQYREEGYLPAAMVNFLSLLGWHPEGDEELMSMDRIVELFDIDRVQKAGAIFNVEKLDWMNAQYIKQLSVDELFEYIEPILDAHGITASKELIMKVISVERDRLKKLSDVIEFDAFFFTLPDYEASLLNWKTTDASTTKQVLGEIKAVLEAYSGDYSHEDLMKVLDPLIAIYSRGGVLWPFRAALSGQKTSPDPLVITGVLGKDEVIRRLDTAISKI